MDELVTARDLPGQRLRFRLAEGEDLEAALEVGVLRAVDLVARMPEPLLLRVVSWADPAPPMETWFPGVPCEVHEGRTEDGFPEHVRTVEVPRAHPGVLAALEAALRGDLEIGLWLFADGILLRPYDDRGADVVASTAAPLSVFRDECGEFLMEDHLDRMVRCELSFVCDVDWQTMAETADPRVRSCAKCAREVHDVMDEDEFLAHARAGHCVAVPPGLVSIQTYTKALLEPDMPPPPPPPELDLGPGGGRLAGAPVYPPDDGRYGFGPVDDVHDRPFWRRLFGKKRGR